MLIPVISTLRTEDFPSQQSWISGLLLPINQFLLSASSALNGNITFGDNIPCQNFTMNFQYNAATDFPKILKWSLSTNSSTQTPQNPFELRCCNATESGVNVTLLPTWSFANGTITISNFVKLTTSGATGLTAGATYVVYLRGQP